MQDLLGSSVDPNYKSVAAELHAASGIFFTEDQVRGKWRRMNERNQTERPFDFDVDGLSLVDYPAIVQTASGDAAICACVHVPQTDPLMWTRYLGIIDRDQIPLAIIAGDIVTGDMFSKWETKESWHWDAELASLRKHLVPLAERVERIVIIPGNHIENRIVRVTNGQIRLKQVLDMANLPDALRERVVTSDFDYLEYLSGGERFLVAHSTNYSKQGGRVPVTYAEKYRAHVIAGNGHEIGWQVSVSGVYHGIDLGTMADPRYMNYVSRALTQYPVMQQSFVTVRSGAIRMYGAGKPVTDWQAELPE